MIGSKLVNRYQIIERIGGGGMAVVYKARCTLLNRIVAVKILRHQFSVDEDFVRRFRREAQAAASLSHPNIVNIYDVGQENDIYFIVMEYVDGESLKDLIDREGPLEPAKAVNITRQIANALYHAHANNIIHRDIKPHNVLIAKDGRVKVADFGIARAVTTTTQTFSPNSLLGSVHYFSPEQAKGNVATEQSDLYSLGIVLYEMLTKHLPFEGDSPVSIALKHLQQNIPPATEYNSAVTPGLQAILGKLLEKEKGRRFQNALELLAALRSWNAPGLFIAQEDSILADDTQDYPPPPTRMKWWAKINKKKALKLSGAVLAIVLAITLAVFGINQLAKVWKVKEIQVPDVVEHSKEDAVAILEAAGLSNYIFTEVFHDTIPAGYVVRQKPAAEQIVKQGRTIELIISSGPVLIDVPLVEGIDVRVAESKLQAVGLKAERTYEYSETHAVDFVIRQDPIEGAKLAKGQVVNLVVSSGPRPFAMPNVLGKTLLEAEEIFSEIALEITRIWNPKQGNSPGGIVVNQSPVEGEDVKPGDIVYLTLRPFNRITKEISIDSLNPEVESRVKIVVKDITGEHVIFEEVLSGRSTYNYTVSGWEAGVIEVYLDGVLIDKTTF